MSKYTTEVRNICEYFSGLGESVGYYKANEVINKSVDKIFNFDYPIFDESYRKVLEKKILKHYYTREIGFETMGVWLLKLDTKLNEIMPYYNKMYESELIEFNPLYDVNVTRSHKGSEKDTKESVESGATDSTHNNINNVNQNNVTDNSSSGSSSDLYSDTPQGAITGLENGNYLTNARKISDTETKHSENHYDSMSNTSSKDKINRRNVNNETVNSTDEYLETVVGKQGTGSMSQMLIKYRETFINIDMMIIEELSDLFMMLW